MEKESKHFLLEDKQKNIFLIRLDELVPLSQFLL